MNDNSKHFFFDGYDIDNKVLADINNMKKITSTINKRFFANQGNTIIIPYFNGKIKTDGGVSGIVIGNNSHFTCHTFCYRNTLFIDYYGSDENHKQMLNEILNVYPTDDYDLCVNNKSIKGKFGKHIIIDNAPHLSIENAKKLIQTILTKIDMTPINNMIINKTDKNSFDIIQPIAESHISIHQTNYTNVIDVFSCKYFDEQKLLKILNVSNYIEINRGIKYQ